MFFWNVKLISCQFFRSTYIRFHGQNSTDPTHWPIWSKIPLQSVIPSLDASFLQFDIWVTLWDLKCSLRLNYTRENTVLRFSMCMITIFEWFCDFKNNWWKRVHIFQMIFSDFKLLEIQILDSIFLEYRGTLVLGKKIIAAKIPYQNEKKNTF